VRVLIVDDEPKARKRMIRLLSAHSGIEIVGEAGDGPTALEMIETSRPDLVLLDIQMPEMSGFDLLEEIPPGKFPLVVFVTAYDQYAIKAFDVNAVDYLLKPVTPERLAKTLERVSRTSSAREAASGADQIRRLADTFLAGRRRTLERVLGRRGGKLQVVPVSAVEVFSAEGELVFASCPQGRLLTNYTLKALENRLDQDRFVRVHKSSIINLDHLRELDIRATGGAVARLASGLTVDVSRRFVSNLRERLS